MPVPICVKLFRWWDLFPISKKALLNMRCFNSSMELWTRLKMQSLVRFIPEAVNTSLRIFPDCLSKFSSSILGEIKSINKIRSREEKSITDLSFIVLLHSVVLDHIYQVSKCLIIALIPSTILSKECSCQQQKTKSSVLLKFRSTPLFESNN